MNNHNTFEALTKSLQFQMSSPLAILEHQFHVGLKIAIFIFIKKRLKELLLLSHVSTGLLTHDHMCSFISINLIGECPEQAVAISCHVSQFDFHGFDLSVEVSIVLQIDMAEFESICFSLFLS